MTCNLVKNFIKLRIYKSKYNIKIELQSCRLLELKK